MASLVLETILSATLGTVLVLPFIGVLFIVNELVRILISIGFKLVYGNQIRLSPAGYDSMYMYDGHKSGGRMVLTVVILDSTQSQDTFDISKYRKNYEEFVLYREEYSKLKEVWIRKWGFTCLKKCSEDEFSIENHVKVYNEVNHNAVTEAELMNEILPELCKDMEDQSIPQWQDIFIPGVIMRSDPTSPKTVRIYRVHHGYMDGLSILMMMADTQSGQCLKTFPWVIDPTDKSLAISPLQKIICYLNFAGACIRNIIESPKFSPNKLWLKPNKFIGRTIHGWTDPIEVSMLKEIKEHTGCSMSALLTTILVNAMLKFKAKYGGWNEHQIEEMVVGMVAALFPYPSSHLVNNHSILKCKLDFRTEIPRRLRLWSIHQELKRLSTHPDVYMNHVLPSLYGKLPTVISNMCTSLITGDGIISNVPASNKRFSMWGDEVISLGGWVPLITPAGFSCVTLRYAESLRYCVNADEAAINDEGMRFLLQTIQEEASLMHKEVSYGRRTKSKGSFLIGRFLVEGVSEEHEQVVDDCVKEVVKQVEVQSTTTTIKYNPNLKKQKRFLRRTSSEIRDEFREMRKHRAMESFISTVNKLKRA